MNLEKLFEIVNSDTQDTLDYDYIISQTNIVPNDDDGGLTFDNGEIKRAKEIETCVLYIDIRNSTELSKKHNPKTMGRLYTAFVKAILKVADYHKALVRNIIGDRVMIVFNSKDYFTNAVDCAISCNTVCQFIINKKIDFNDFKFGIGIDYGKMTVLKVGIAKQGKERDTYKNLVWVGNPANIASKLTDIANKTIIEQNVILKIDKKSINPYNPSNQQTISIEDFAKNVSIDTWNKMLYKNEYVINYQFSQKNITYPPILMTEQVFEGFKKANKERKCIKENYWEKQNVNIKQYNKEVYGGDIYWEAIKNVNI